MGHPCQSDGIKPLPVLQDNVVWIWARGREAVVVDPAVAEPVRQWLVDRKLELAAVLQTHHHADHIGGTPDLLRQWPSAAVIAAAADQERIPFQTVSVEPGMQLELLGQPISVIDVRAHTRAHLAYVLPQGCSPELPTPVLFCGDTLFGAGCGRLFEGSAEDMHLALKRLQDLPDDTIVHCAHEYTEGNLRWAHALRPDDQAIAARLSTVQDLRSRGSLSLPSTMGEERRTNLFLRACSVQELRELRLHKDSWSG
ncbi:hydroxyacylglutathione hydrolase [Synechococcus sp. MIT S9220]|uniref:hydroxyacylglutathione hydrolase n=1 Tax=unclassified Synechococcus TaxID=2626047 RepID=UPI000140D04E|nr:hydroxyacylglutathione hydrolase [Synechococcus sp. MIT S9220]NOL46446.1 hydroxyacylglutathione hydrolase [Synechococcus sp. MIT S9220]QNJ23448.1 hydroxyacylglutathione hydrolase [Synechococcus sp. MIT S9220]CAI8387758.1 MAG: Hydroxyacylglutathione hydrolase [Synechococcus sp. MIT S9220]|tara:strand:+ start:2818 stop:3582 length:765 start_codon:yes stop_codon:yes gene_type:complete